MPAVRRPLHRDGAKEKYMARTAKGTREARRGRESRGIQTHPRPLGCSRTNRGVFRGYCEKPNFQIPDWIRTVLLLIMSLLDSRILPCRPLMTEKGIASSGLYLIQELRSII